MRYAVPVAVTMGVHGTYIIEANDCEEAIEKAKKGDTIDEDMESSRGEVIDRTVTGEPVELA